MSPALRQILAVLACTFGLICLTGQLNHALAPFGLTLEVAGLLCAFAGLRLEFSRAFTVALLTGFLVDAGTPVGFGRHAFLFGLMVCLLSRVRFRLPREETLVGVVTALFINLACFVVTGFVALGSLPDTTSGALRLLADLLVSQLFIALIGPWFFALQLRALAFAGASPATAIRRYA